MSHRYYQLLTRARRNARRDYSAWCVAEIDHEDGRRLFCMPLDATEYDEFEAFDGCILTICYADGLVENVRTINI